jgi:hypothetical protein
METTDFIDVRSRIAELELDQPTRLAILPDNLESAESPANFVYAASSEDVTKLLRTNGLQIEALSPRPLTTRRDNDYTIVLPTLFVAAAHLTENPDSISVVLGVIANYATRRMQGVPGGGKVRASIAVETTKTKSVKRIDYEGPPSGLSEMAKLVESTHGEE